jgi:hypothetical protein
MENIPQRTIDMLSAYFEKNGIDYELTGRPVPQPQYQPQPQPDRPSEGFGGSPLSLK